MGSRRASGIAFHDKAELPIFVGAPLFPSPCSADGESPYTSARASHTLLPCSNVEPPNLASSTTSPRSSRPWKFPTPSARASAAPARRPSTPSTSVIPAAWRSRMTTPAFITTSTCCRPKSAARTACALWVHQVHGGDVITIRPNDGFESGPKADAMVTDDPRARFSSASPIASRFFSPAAKADSSRRSTQVGAASLPTSSPTRSRRANTDARSIIAVIGPAISFNAFEVGPEVLDEFQQKFQDPALIRRRADGKGYVDLRTAILRQLQQASVADRWIRHHRPLHLPRRRGVLFASPRQRRHRPHGSPYFAEITVGIRQGWVEESLRAGPCPPVAVLSQSCGRAISEKRGPRYYSSKTMVARYAGFILATWLLVAAGCSKPSNEIAVYSSPKDPPPATAPAMPTADSGAMDAAAAGGRLSGDPSRRQCTPTKLQPARWRGPCQRDGSNFLAARCALRPSRSATIRQCS